MAKEKDLSSRAVSIGVFFAVIKFIGDGFQSIVSNSRPASINFLVFSWITACIELIFIFPFFLYSIINRRKNRKSIFIGNKEDIIILSEKNALISIFSMGALFGILHTCWYQVFRALPLSIASLIVIPSALILIQNPSALIMIQNKKKKEKQIELVRDNNPDNDKPTPEVAYRRNKEK